MSRIKVVCIKDGDGVCKGDILTAWKQFNRMFYMAGTNLKVAIAPAKFWEQFMALNPYYVVEKPLLKRRFRKPKRQFLQVDFPGISDKLLGLLYVCDFLYIEEIKNLNPIFIEQFNYSIVSTLEKLQMLYHQIPEYQFEQAIINSEQVFKEMYNMSIELENQNFNGGKSTDELLKSFMEDNNILSDFFKEMKK